MKTLQGTSDGEQTQRYKARFTDDKQFNKENILKQLKTSVSPELKEQVGQRRE